MCRLTNREREILETLLVNEVKVAAKKLGISPATIYGIRHRIKYKKMQAQEFLRELRKYKAAL